MIVAIASGKGGTGKTTVAASLAWVWKRPVVAVDLDVEEPNLHLFLRPRFEGRRPASLEVPIADEARCNRCGACAELCQFKAIAVLGTVLLTFPEMCHGCGGCLAVCPEGALAPGGRELGEVLWGPVDGGRIGFCMGRLRVGEALSPPLMRAVIAQARELALRDEADLIIDAPPGTSCPAIQAVSPADLIVLVTEPTPFGFHDFRLAHEAFLPLGKPMAVVVNRADLGEEDTRGYCRRSRLPILAEIPHDRRIARAYAQGAVVAAELSERRDLFDRLATEILRRGDVPRPLPKDPSHA
ncbi:MAG: ATP-binding protein [Desulfobacterales bacterium]